MLHSLKRYLDDGYTSVLDPDEEALLDDAAQTSADADRHGSKLMPYQAPPKVAAYVPSADKVAASNAVATAPRTAPYMGGYLRDEGDNVAQWEGPPPGQIAANDEAQAESAVVKAPDALGDRYTALAKLYGERPVESKSKWWQKVGAAALGGAAGWSNAAGRTRTPIDISAATEGILHPGYAGKLQDWQNKVVPAQEMLKLEGERVAAQQSAALSAANVADKQADAAWKQGVGRSNEVVVTPAISEASGGKYAVGSKIPATLASTIENNMAGRYDPKQPRAAVTIQEKYDEAQRIQPPELGGTPAIWRQMAYNPTQVEKADKPDPIAQQNHAHWINTVNSTDPNVTPEQKEVARKNLQLEKDMTVGTRVSITNATAPGNQPARQILPGSREYKIAQQLSDGRLTFDQMSKIYAYSRDPSLKADILNFAGELNRNFNPALFSQGYKFASNPKIMQQMASLSNVEAGVPDLLKFSDAASRSGATILNKAIIPGGIAVGGKKYSNFNTARIAFADELSGALGYGSATDMSREMGFNMVDPNLSPDSFRSAVQDVIIPFISRKRESLLGPMGIYGTTPAQAPGQTPPAGTTPPAAPVPAQKTTTRSAVQAYADDHKVKYNVAEKIFTDKNYRIN